MQQSVNEATPVLSAQSSVHTGSFGRTGTKLKTLEDFISNKKGKARNDVVPKKKKQKIADVTINIGHKHLVDMELKTVWGKRLPITVAKSATYNDVLSRSVAKWSAFDRNFDASIEYVLLYEDGSYALFMPGGYKDFFDLEKYKNELGKEYKQITLFLCTKNDYDQFEAPSSANETNDVIEVNDFMTCDSISEYSDANYLSANNLLNNNRESDIQPLNVSYQLAVDEQCARELDSHLNGNATESSVVPKQAVPTLDTVVNTVRSKVEDHEQFFVITRRGVPLQRILQLWQRQKLKSPITGKLMIKYSGEDGIDQGAIAKEFLEDAVKMIGEQFFPNGSPVDSTYHIQNGNFQSCGEIAAVSVAQGGPFPKFLDKCAYSCMVGDTDVREIKDTDLTANEREILIEIKQDYSKYTDRIIDCGYTGCFDQDHCEEMINSMKVSFVSKRSLYMKEFAKGMIPYGIHHCIKEDPSVCESLFVNSCQPDVAPDADYLFSLLKPQFAELGSTRRTVEELVMDNFQDMLHAVEDSLVTGHSSAIAWNYDDAKSDAEHADEKFQAIEISIPNILGWLTGQRHRSKGSWEDLSIQVNFDHECKERAPSHTICFPTVASCSRELTLPIIHMKEEGKFQEIFTLAFCKGNSFARH